MKHWRAMIVLPCCAAMCCVIGSTNVSPAIQSRPAAESQMEYGIHTLRADGELLQMVHDAGARWVVELFSWREIAQWRGEYDWEYPDAVVRGAEFYGLKVAARLDQQPAWARRAPAKNGPPDDLNDYADFVEAVAARYRGRVAAYIIWNEPNLAFEWGSAPPDPAAYVDMLRVAYQRAKRADPDCLVVSAGLAPTNHHDPTAMDDRLYLEGMYQAGAAAYFDVLGAHPYGFAYDPYAPYEAGDGLNFSRLSALRDIMVRYGDAYKPVWATEVGWTVGTVWHAVSLAHQADYLVGAFQRAQQEWPWLTMMAAWTLSRSLPTEDEKQGYNMLDELGRPRPVYFAFRELARRAPRSSDERTRQQAGRVEILASDVTLHLGDSELPPPWRPLRKGANPADTWEADFYILDPGTEDWTLYAELMQPNERTSTVYINGQRLTPNLPVEDYSRTWTAHTWQVPINLLRPGLNRLQLQVGMDLPDYQQTGYVWDDVQIRHVFLAHLP